MSFRLALHWAITAVSAAALSTVAAIPFTGWAASTVGVCAVAGVCAAGYASTPTTRKDGVK